MSSLAAILQPVGAYPERRPDAHGRHEPRLGQGLVSALAEWRGAMAGQTALMLSAVRARETAAAGEDEILARARGLAGSLRRPRSSFEAVAGCLALTSDIVERQLGFRPHDVQLAGAWHMLCGRLIEMDTGEGKTVTAVFTAAAHGLAGRQVHVVTVNDYLAERDAHEMGPIYRALGLDVACVKQGMSEAERIEAYRAAIVYVTPKQLMFDYLRDRIRLGGAASSPLRTELAVLREARAQQGASGFYLNGLQAAILDEADSVLIDEAVVPLIISRQELSPDQAKIAEDAIALARRLRQGEDFMLAAAGRDLWLTDAGRERLEHLARPIEGVFAAKLWREQYCEQALVALNLFQRDRDYILRDGAIEIVDINTGRTMPDRSWERGLHQMIQAKEGIAITAPNESLARISHQSFFQRYLNLCGMSGTLSEVAGEIRKVYGVRTIRIPPHLASRRRALGISISKSNADKDRIVVRRAAALAKAGRAVLIGTRTVADSERLSAALAAAGVAHRTLNARHDETEAKIIADAGAHGAVTVATNMAGRGTDIRLDPSVREAGGLHVIATERHASRRIDRQLFGRAARQGDPGSCEEILSLEDDIIANHLPRWARQIAHWPIGLRLVLMRAAQRRASHAGKKVRANLTLYEEQMDQALAFAGRPRG